MHPEDLLKMQQEQIRRSSVGIGGQAAVNDTCCNQAYRPTLREEAEKAMSYHSEQAQQKEKAAKFFIEHPEFDEFIRLIRSGAIGI